MTMTWTCYNIWKWVARLRSYCSHLMTKTKWSIIIIVNGTRLELIFIHIKVVAKCERFLIANYSFSIQTIVFEMNVLWKCILLCQFIFSIIQFYFNSILPGKGCIFISNSFHGCSLNMTVLILWSGVDGSEVYWLGIYLVNFSHGVPCQKKCRFYLSIVDDWSIVDVGCWN